MRHHLDIEFGQSVLQTQIEFSYRPGSRAYYNRAGSWDQGDPPEIDVLKILIRQSSDSMMWHDCPSWLVDILADDEWIQSELIEAAENLRQEREDNSQFGVGA